MSEEKEISYFDESVDFPSIDREGCTILEKLRELFPDQSTHYKKLAQIYSFCFPKEPVNKPVFEKSDEEVISEIHNTPISLDLGEVLQEQTEDTKKYYMNNELFGRRVANIPVLIDFAYIYYIWRYDKNAPVFELPASILKFNVIASAAQVPDDKLKKYFMTCITDPFIRDLRNERPPFMMRTDMSQDEIKDKIREVVEPLCRKILMGLYEFDMSS